jgi:hypothetical protein
MTSSFADGLSGYYQIPEDASGAEEVLVDADLIDFGTEANLIDPADEENLTGETFESRVLSGGNNITSLVVTNKSPVSINVTNRQQSEVDTSLLGIQRSETALGLLENVNIYGINRKEWGEDRGGRFFYNYFTDPTEWYFRDDYGCFRRHVPAESAIQAYCYPPPVSFSYDTDDNSGRFPGGFTNGVMNAFWESKRTFRYQPGRVTGFTFGVRMSTGSNYEGERIRWGCRNDYGDGYFFQSETNSFDYSGGDGYYFQLEKGTDLFIIYRRYNPFTEQVEEFKIAREEWNGDQVSLFNSDTGWVLDLSKVTMFKIEFSWYGAVGAKFLAYVPVDSGEARWVKLHYVIIENQLEFPSLRSAFMRMFIQARNTAGASSPAFINLYGSSVYIDGGDRGTVTLGSAALDVAKNIDTTARTILGLQVKGTINDVKNQKAVYPVGLAAFASVPARLDLVLQGNGIRAEESYFYANGTNLTRGASSPIAVTRVGDNELVGSFPNISAELSGTTDYLTGRRVRVIGSGIFNTHVVATTGGRITTDRPLPLGTTSINLARLNAYAVASGIIPSGVVSGTVFFNDGGGQWRLGAWTQSSGQPYSAAANVVWFASKFTGLNYDRNGNEIGEQRLPYEPYRLVNFAIDFPSGTSNTVINFTNISNENFSKDTTMTLAGITSPWPISLVAEVMDNSQLNDVVVTLGTAEERIVPGSGTTTAISQWSAASGLSQDSSSAGGTSYVANKFEASSSDPLSAVLIDSQGYRTLRSPQRVATYFIGSGETKQFDLSNLFGPDKMFITGRPGTINNSGALFVMATSRAASGVASVTLNWEEQ